MSHTNSHIRNWVLVGVLFAQSIFAAEPPKGYVQVTAIGSAETRDSALIDACRLAIAKVHGTRMLGVMSNRNSDGIKIDAAGHSGGKEAGLSVFGRTTDVGDNTSMTFGGLLLRYEVVKEEKESGPTGRWKVHVKGDVLNTLPDKFAGRQSVKLPAVQKIASKLVSAGASPELVQEIAQALQTAVRNTFENHPQFVILDRENDDEINEELALANDDNAAVIEKSKLKGKKVADIIVIVNPEPIKVTVNTVTFEEAPPLQKVQIQISGLFLLKDPTTGGEIGSVKFEAKNPKAIPSAGEIAPAVAKAFEDLKSNLDNSLRSAKCNLLGRLGLANMVYSKSGGFALSGGIDPNLISNGDKLSIWKGEGTAVSKVAEGIAIINGSSVSFETLTASFVDGDALTFRIEAAPPAVSAKSESTGPKKPSLKDRLNFD